MIKGMVGGMKIVTHFVYPPIPDRRFDWCAWTDEIGEEGPRGFGATEEEAIADLMIELESRG